MYSHSNCYTEVKTSQSFPQNPYPLSSSPNGPQLPAFDQRAWYLRRDQPMPPTIGFKFDILNGSTNTPPYPEKDTLGIGSNAVSYPIKPNEDGSAEIPSSYKSDDASSDIEDINDSLSSENPSVPNAKSFANSEDRDFFTQDIIEVKEAKPESQLKGERMHFTRRGLPYPVEAYAKMDHLPCDHSGGDHCTEF